MRYSCAAGFAIRLRAEVKTMAVVKGRGSDCGCGFCVQIMCVFS